MDKKKILEQMKENLKELERMGFNEYQIDEIYNGLKSDIDINNISKYADPKFNVDQMEEIRQGIKAGVDILKYANPMFHQTTLEAIREDLIINKEIEKKKKEPEMEI